MSPRNRTSGFTIIELIVVIALLGIIATVVVPNLDNLSPRYKLRSAARTVGQTVAWARSLGGGVGREYVLRYRLEDSTVEILLPPEPDEDPDLDFDQRESLGAEVLPDGVEITGIIHPDGSRDEYGTVDLVLDKYGSSGSHIAILSNEDEQSIGVYFQAILGTTDYIPGDDAEFPQW
ncbi:MAG: hypothetical protein CBC13_11220 [Planctomycetia bacterium TMED53]|nr:MAG: hypothetical protein CBC13_11220 [Planctomycetia bacterium TMED53]